MGVHLEVEAVTVLVQRAELEFVLHVVAETVLLPAWIVGVLLMTYVNEHRRHASMNVSEG